VINIHDTYYVISSKDAFVLSSSTFFLTGLFYLIFDFYKIKLISILSLIHIYGSLIFISLTFYYFRVGLSLESIQRFGVVDAVDYNTRIIISLLFFVILQLVLVLNLIISTIKKLLYSTPQ